MGDLRLFDQLPDIVKEMGSYLNDVGQTALNWNGLASENTVSQKLRQRGTSPQPCISVPGAEHLGHVRKVFGRKCTEVLTVIESAPDRERGSIKVAKGVEEAENRFCAYQK